MIQMPHHKVLGKNRPIENIDAVHFPLYQNEQHKNCNLEGNIVCRIIDYAFWSLTIVNVNKLVKNKVTSCVVIYTSGIVRLGYRRPLLGCRPK